MKPQRIITPIILCICLIAGGILIAACTPALASPQKDDQSIIETAVAATLVQYIIETKVAAQSINLELQATSQVQPTSTPAPTETPLPVVTEAPTAIPPTPTLVPTAIPLPQSALAPLTASTTLPEAYANMNTNCRAGPSLYYKVVSYLIEGASSPIHGRDSRGAYWYIEHPTKTGQFCWVWTGSTTAIGDTSKVPLVEAPIVDENYYSGNYGSCNPYDPYCNSSWYGGYTSGYSNYCFPNFIYNCKPNQWWCCKPVIKWICQFPWKNPCKKSGCPPVTEVNYKSYCTKYPKCCK
jgi:hypothetical protein